MQELRDKGYLPEAVRNYLALLGWGYDDETTFFTTEELERNFSLERVSKNPAVFDEQKLRWMNGRYVRELTVDDLTARLEALHRPHRPARRGRGHAGEDLDARRVLAAGAARSSTSRSTTPRRARSSSLPEAGAKRAAGRPRGARRASRTRGRPRAVEPALRDAVERSGMKAKQVFQPLRVALTGTTISPGIFETVALIGRDRALARIDARARPPPRRLITSHDGDDDSTVRPRLPIGDEGRQWVPCHDPPESPSSDR